MSGTHEDWERDPLDGASSEDVDARFAAIVSGLAADMSWSATSDELDAAAASLAAGPRTGSALPDQPGPTGTADDESGAAAAAERARRRAIRKAIRAEEVAAYEAEKQRVQAEIDSDQEHFVPPEPPPLPRPRRRTVAALLLLAAGLSFLAWPEMVEVAPDAVMILGLILILCGLGVLLSLLRRRADDPAEGDGWDDGARL